nr:MAG TPA: hypothetical protein [Caudoviricetes sp.]
MIGLKGNNFERGCIHMIQKPRTDGAWWMLSGWHGF